MMTTPLEQKEKMMTTPLEQKEKMMTAPASHTPVVDTEKPAGQTRNSAATIDLASLLGQLQQAAQQKGMAFDLHIEDLKGLHIRFHSGAAAEAVNGMPTPTLPITAPSPTPTVKRQLTPLSAAAVVAPPQENEKGQAVSPTQAVDQEEVSDALKRLMANLLYFEDAEAISDYAAFTEQGMDSVTGVEFINMINRTFDLSLKAIVIYDNPSIRALSAHIQSLLAGAKGPAASPHQPAIPAANHAQATQPQMRDILARVANGELTPQESSARLESLRNGSGEATTSPQPAAAISKEAVWDLLQKHMVKILPAVAGQIRYDHTFDQLGFDSMEQVEVIVMTLESLELNTPLVEIEQAKTVGELAERISLKARESFV
jgi:acyl carrier protein